MTEWMVEIFRIMAQGVLLFSAGKLMTGIIPFLHGHSLCYPASVFADVSTTSIYGFRIQISCLLTVPRDNKLSLVNISSTLTLRTAGRSVNHPGFWVAEAIRCYQHQTTQCIAIVVLPHVPYTKAAKSRSRPSSCCFGRYCYLFGGKISKHCERWPNRNRSQCCPHIQCCTSEIDRDVDFTGDLLWCSCSSEDTRRED
jgi:hypothetical protein